MSAAIAAAAQTLSSEFNQIDGTSTVIEKILAVIEKRAGSV